MSLIVDIIHFFVIQVSVITDDNYIILQARLSRKSVTCMAPYHCVCLLQLRTPLSVYVFGKNYAVNKISPKKFQ